MSSEALYTGFTDEEIPDREIWRPEVELKEDPILLTQALRNLPSIPKVKPSKFTGFAFFMPDEEGIGFKNFSFEGRRHVKRMYDTPAKRILLFCGRQVEKSTMLGNIALCYMSMVSAYKVLYVSPSATQTKTFSADRIKEPIETSPILRKFTTTMLSSNILEKQFVNRSKITMRYAFLNADRCVAGDTRVHFTNGSVTTVKDVYEDPTTYLGKSVWAANPENKGVEPATLTDVVCQGVRSVFDVHVTGGVELRCTDNQPLLTWTGWRQLHELRRGDFIAVPNQLEHGAGIERPVEEFRLVGYLLGDGATKTVNACSLHNGNEEVLQDFRRCAVKLGASLWREQNSNKKHWVHSKTKRQGFGGGRLGYKKRLLELGVIGAHHVTKHVPHELFAGNEEQIAALLGGLFAADGWASVSKSQQYEIGYSSNSKQLLVDIRQLLLRFGIHAFISKQKKPSTKNALGAYTLSIRHHDSVKSFVAHIEVPGKQQALQQVLAVAKKITSKKNDYDRVPFSYAEARAYLKERHGLSTHSAWKKYRIQLRPGNTKDSIGRQVLHSWGVKLGDSWLLWLSTSPLGWARIKEVIPAGREQTYDLTIHGLENYLSDGVYVHNTRGIPAWMLQLDEFQDILSDNIPVIEQCLSHAPERWKRFLYAGTPKSLDNNIEYYRERLSTQGEWVVPCDRHTPSHWNILGEKNIGKKGLVCEKCGKLINPMTDRAQWARMVEKAPFESYRIPQLMVPWKPWEEVLLDYERYPRDKFYNEVLGISYDSGMRPLTTEQMRAVCNPNLHMVDYENYRDLSYSQPIYAGIDWGCHDEDTRILTESGYKYFRDLSDEDKVAQWDPDTREMSFVTPLARTVRDWDQPMLHFKTKGGLDLMVTHTHRMRVGISQGLSWLTESAGELAQRGGNANFVGHVTWKGEEQEAFTLPGLPASSGYKGSQDALFKMDDWLELLGYLLSEGGVCLDDGRPSCLKMSQRETVNPEKYLKIQDCLTRMEIPHKAFPNPVTGDVNWTIYGKQYWHWVTENCGALAAEKRVPRQFLELSPRQLRILFHALVDGDGYVDPRDGCDSGAYYSTSKGLCEDFQELCIRLGRRCVVKLHKPAEGNRRARWRAMWSTGRDHTFNTPSTRVERVPYKGKVYCCAVPSGYIVTERNGCVSYQGNTGEHSYTVITLCTYVDMKFRCFYAHRFVGEEVDPPLQLERICELLNYFNVRVVGTDYGGGFDRNDHLIRKFGPQRIWKYQYVARAQKKVEWDTKLGRFKAHRTEVMSDIFNAIKRGKECEFPRWEDWRDPHGQDFLNIFSEYSETLKMVQYKHGVDKPDDTFHSFVTCWLASMMMQPRPDIILPRKESKSGVMESMYSGPTDQY